jgi:UDP-glucose 4-epimerase
MKVFVTGGAGFIGSHTCVELLKAGHEVVIYDNFFNAHPEVLGRIGKIAGKQPECVRGDVRDFEAVRAALKDSRAEAVIHFAGLKAVGESVEKPLMYYDWNVVGAVRVLEAMQAEGVKKFIFSSSATVYGVPQRLPLTEDHPLAALSPYGQTKLMIENIMRDVSAADSAWKVGILRYFNPVGAHESGLIGEDPKGIPNNLFPFVAQVAVGQRESLNVWGDDYDTPDGTGVRDYIHVVDLAQGHVRALERLGSGADSFTVNLGTGQGYSVLDVVRAFEKASGKPVPYKIMPRRAGDVTSCYADPSYAKTLLGWQAQRGLDQMCADGWNWQSRNPKGYAGV